jgi:hypothetical protein
MSDDACSVLGALRGLLREQAGEGAGEWLEEAIGDVGTPPRQARLRVAFSRAGRRLGDRAISVTPEQQVHLDAIGVGSLRAWTLRDLGRAILVLVTSSSLSPEEQVAWVESLFRTGELGEQQSIVRMLSLLPEPQRFASLAAEATRTNAVGVFEALACDNTYPTHHMTDLAFNQMVMKAIFTEIPVERIVGLPERVTRELVRMAQDYGSERGAAGRSVPSDIALLERWLERQP